MPRLHLLTLSLITVAVALIIVAATGCSDEDPITVEDFVKQYPSAFCGYVFKCCKASERSYGGENQCKVAAQELLDEAFDWRGVSGVKVTFNHVGAQSCLDKLNGADCKDATLFEGCLFDAVTPGQAQSADCKYSAECTSFYCVQPQQHSLGSCGSSGAGCSGLDRSCAQGYCGAGNQCLVKKKDGDQCNAPNECTSGICSPTYKQCVAAPKQHCAGQ